MFNSIRVRLALTLGTLGIILSSVVGATSASAATTSTMVWVQQSPSVAPTARDGAAMVYDAALKSVLLFGGTAQTGCGSASICDDTWLWNGSTWTQSVGTQPPARDEAAIAYDSTLSEVVLFGGYGSGGALQDTWIFNQNGWSKVTSPTFPPARGFAQMAYDQANNSIVLFGGIGLAGALNDTWVWNNGTWTQQQPASSPAPRYEHSIAYDEATQTVVLFGGISPSATYFDDTWTWAGNTWTKQTAGSAPTPRGGTALGYDATTRALVLFGGLGAPPTQPLYNDTWTWNGHAWSIHRGSTTPPARTDSRLVFDATTHSAVMFGGCGVSASCGTLLGDTWEFQATP